MFLHGATIDAVSVLSHKIVFVSSSGRNTARRDLKGVAGVSFSTGGEKHLTRGSSFDRQAKLYDRWRPGHPIAVFDDIVALSGISSDARLLEIGCGTGHATLHFARRGYHLRAVEPGRHLARCARERLRDFPRVQIDVAPFEAVRLDARSVDLVFCASAFHWLDLGLAFESIARCLVPGGFLAAFWSAQSPRGAQRPLMEALAPIYEHWAPEFATQGRGPAQELIDRFDCELLRWGCWTGPPVIRDYSWTVAYDSVGYTNFLSTHSSLLCLPVARRRRLLGAIADVVRSKFRNHIVCSMWTKLFLVRRNRKTLGTARVLRRKVGATSR